MRMELAAALHHSSFRGAGLETHDAPRSQKTVNSREEAVFFELYDEDTAGWRPAPLPEVAGPHAQVLQRTVEPIVDAVPLVPLLDDPVPQTVEQLQDVLKFFDALIPDPDQVIEVPKIITEDVPVRAVLRATQLAEQLVEVPTIISFSMILLLHALLEQRTVEQNVDIPAVGGSGTGGGLSGFPPGQNCSMTAEQIVDNPVPRPDVAGDLQGFSPWTGFNSVFGADSRVSRSRRWPSRFSASPGLRSVFLGFSWTSWSGGFSHFSPPEKKCEDPAHPGVGTGC